MGTITILPVHRVKSKHTEVVQAGGSGHQGYQGAEVRAEPGSLPPQPDSQLYKCGFNQS